MDPASLVLGIALIIFSIILHEVAHGYVADFLGDPTARYSGRLTLNPLPHIDPIGSLLLPGFLAMSGSPFMMGWAKPVPYNPNNLQYGRLRLSGDVLEALVAFAGPAANILIAVISGLLLRFGFFTPEIGSILITLAYSNLSLAVLNLIPIPPLDGSKVIRALLPYQLARRYEALEGFTYTLGPFGLIGVLILFIYVFSGPAGAFVSYLFSLITGYP